MDHKQMIAELEAEQSMFVRTAPGASTSNGKSLTLTGRPTPSNALKNPSPTRAAQRRGSFFVRTTTVARIGVQSPPTRAASRPPRRRLWPLDPGCGLAIPIVRRARPPESTEADTLRTLHPRPIDRPPGDTHMSVNTSGEGGGDSAIVFEQRIQDLCHDEIFEAGTGTEVAYDLMKNELLLDGSARLNLATFVTTWMPPAAAALFFNGRQEHDRQGRIPADRRDRVTVQSSGPWAGIPACCSESCEHGACRGGGDI